MLSMCKSTLWEDQGIESELALSSTWVHFWVFFICLLLKEQWKLSIGKSFPFLSMLLLSLVRSLLVTVFLERMWWLRMMRLRLLKLLTKLSLLWQFLTKVLLIINLKITTILWLSVEALLCFSSVSFFLYLNHWCISSLLYSLHK